MSLNEWIRIKLLEHNYDTASVYQLYSVCKKETGTTALLESFKTKVRKQKKILIESGGEYTPKVESNTSTNAIIKEEDDRNLKVITNKADIQTVEDLISYCNIDTSIWKVHKSRAGVYGNEENPMYQVRAEFVRKDIEEDEDPKEAIKLMLSEMKEYAPVYPKIKYTKNKEKNLLLEIGLFDHHFGQLSWGKETGSHNYDSVIAYNLAMQAVDYMLSNVDIKRVDRILLPIGNDFFNVNSSSNTTFAGTPQTEDGRWKKTYVRGRELWVEIIEKCMQIAPVDVLIVPGNHDFERTFYLGDSLECWFSKSKDVTIDNSPLLRKYYQYGKNAIMFTHGDKEVRGTLHHIMAQERPDIWAQSEYREIHTGHVHHETAKAIKYVNEMPGVDILTFPTLVGMDDYHYGKGYSSRRESIGMIFEKDHGKIASLYFRPKVFE